jgi:hypothetical protein
LCFLVVVVSPFASVEVVVLVALCVVSVPGCEDEPLCASAGFAGVVFCDISFGVLLSVFGVALSDCGVAVLSGVVVVVVEFVVVLVDPLLVAGFAQG